MKRLFAVLATFVLFSVASPVYAQGGTGGCTFEFSNYFNNSDIAAPVNGVITYTKLFELGNGIVGVGVQQQSAPLSGTLSVDGCGSTDFTTPGSPYVVCCTQSITCGGVDYSAQSICEEVFYGNIFSSEIPGPTLGPSQIDVSGVALDQSEYPLVITLNGYSYTTTINTTPTPTPTTSLTSTIPYVIVPIPGGQAQPAIYVIYSLTIGEIILAAVILLLVLVIAGRWLYDVAMDVFQVRNAAIGSWVSRKLYKRWINRMVE